MARTTITPISVPDRLATTVQPITWIAADVANGNQFVPTGREVVLARNTDGVNPRYVDVTSAPLAGRLGDVDQVNIAASGQVVLPYFQLEGWIQTDGFIYLDGETAGVEFAVLRLPS